MTGIYVHVPFCAVRCGYCDFTTYAPSELGGATAAGYADAALKEMDRAAAVLAERSAPDEQGPAGGDRMTVYFGGGTPTLLPVAMLTRLLRGVEEAFGIGDPAEITIEANPDSVTGDSLGALREAGFTRVSLGMQSAVPSVLATLERTHRPENVSRAVEGAQAAGLDVSVDLIYGTPGETLADWERTVAVALDLAPDHLSAYALVIEPGTRMGAALRRGQIAPVDPDLQADLYEAADDAFHARGYEWYEVSNWAKDRPCLHNLGYWRGDDWWGIGPGAHSHLKAWNSSPAIRKWNVKHPWTYIQRIEAGQSPEDGREELTVEQEAVERILLGIRCRDGVDLGSLEGREDEVGALVGDGLLDGEAFAGGRAVLTRRGRLLADAVVRALT